MFIAVDGIDGAGKSTQIRMLVEYLRRMGKTCIAVRDPGTTRAGEAIRGLVLDSDLEMHRRCEALLYMAARSQLVEECIRPALDAGNWVVSDRFLLANVVYQSVKGGVDAELLWRLGEIATDGIKPHLTLLLDISAEGALRRLDRPMDRMESRGAEYLGAVRQAFLLHVGRTGGRYAVIDAENEIDAVHRQIVAAVEEYLDR